MSLIASGGCKKCFRCSDVFVAEGIHHYLPFKIDFDALHSWISRIAMIVFTLFGFLLLLCLLRQLLLFLPIIYHILLIELLHLLLCFLTILFVLFLRHVLGQLFILHYLLECSIIQGKIMIWLVSDFFNGHDISRVEDCLLGLAFDLSSIKRFWQLKMIIIIVKCWCNCRCGGCRNVLLSAMVLLDLLRRMLEHRSEHGK